jgi:hypothetical protein
MAAEIHVGDAGLAFRATVKDDEGVVVDISGATALKMWLRRPDGTTVEKTATTVNGGSDGVMQYVTQEGDLSSPGMWSLQGQVTIGATVYHTTIHRFMVGKNLQ